MKPDRQEAITLLVLFLAVLVVCLASFGDPTTSRPGIHIDPAPAYAMQEDDPGWCATHGHFPCGIWPVGTPDNE